MATEDTVRRAIAGDGEGSDAAPQSARRIDRRADVGGAATDKWRRYLADMRSFAADAVPLETRACWSA